VSYAQVSHLNNSVRGVNPLEKGNFVI